MTEQRPPLPPFTEATAIQKVQAAEDGWNNRNPEKFLWHIPLIASGETVRNFSVAVQKLSIFLPANGKKKKTID